MGWGGKGKGPWPCTPHHHHHHGPGALAVAEAVVVGGVAAAAIASTVGRPRPRPHPVALPEQRVVVVGSAAPTVAAPVVPVQAVYVSDGVVVRGAAARPIKGKGKGKRKAAPVAQQEGLDVARIQLPADALQFRDSVTFFAVDVQPRVGESWRVMRRYNDFYKLSSSIGSPSFPGAPLPRKLFTSCRGHKLDERRQGLELWLRRAIENPSSGGAWLRPLKQFLEAGRETLITASSLVSSTAPSATVVPSPAQALAVQPPLEIPAAAATAEEETILEISIPSGVSAGQMLGVNVPNGQQLTVVVPEGLNPGARLELHFDPKNNTLTPLM